ncbi:PREDICTED: uncharacterized protein LOC101299539 [Fragaria vesca subsp. vesca]
MLSSASTGNGSFGHRLTQSPPPIDSPLKLSHTQPKSTTCNYPNVGPQSLGHCLADRGTVSGQLLSPPLPPFHLAADKEQNPEALKPDDAVRAAAGASAALAPP